MVSFSLADLKNDQVAGLAYVNKGDTQEKWDRLGKRTTRLKVHELIVGDDRFYVQAMTISDKTCFLKRWVQRVVVWLWYVKVGQDNGIEIYVKVSSLARRLLLDATEILDASKENSLQDLIARQRRTFHPLVEPVNNDAVSKEAKEAEGKNKANTQSTEAEKEAAAQAEVERKRKEAEQKLAISKEAELLHLNSKRISECGQGQIGPEKLNALINAAAQASLYARKQFAAKNSADQKQSVAAPFKFGDDCEIIPINEQGYKFEFIAFYTKKGVHLIQHSNQLAPLKSFPHVYKVFDFIAQQPRIFKTNQPKKNGDRVDVEREAKILHEVHAKGAKAYVQDPPIATLSFSHIGFKGLLYPFHEQGDLNSFIHQLKEPQWFEIKAYFEDLLQALEQFSTLQRHHGDMKPLNVLITKQCLKFIDWEASTKYGEGVPEAWSPAYSHEPDIDVIQLKSGPEKTALIEKLDVYAFGVMLYQLVTLGQFPKYAKTYEQLEPEKRVFSFLTEKPKQGRFLGFKLNREHMQKAGCPETVMNFLDKMLDQDIMKRLSVKDALEQSSRNHLVWFTHAKRESRVVRPVPLIPPVKSSVAAAVASTAADSAISQNSYASS